MFEDELLPEDPGDAARTMLDWAARFRNEGTLDEIVPPSLLSLEPEGWSLVTVPEVIDLAFRVNHPHAKPLLDRFFRRVVRERRPRAVGVLCEMWQARVPAGEMPAGSIADQPGATEVLVLTLEQPGLPMRVFQSIRIDGVFQPACELEEFDSAGRFVDLLTDRSAVRALELSMAGAAGLEPATSGLTVRRSAS